MANAVSPPIPRRTFPCDDFVERERLEPPAPSSDYAQEKIPSPYTMATHEKLAALRVGKLEGGAAVIGKAAGWTDLCMDWSGDAGSTPAAYPYFVRGRDSLRVHITELFNTEITMYDGAMGTMIQKQKDWLDEAAFRGDRFKDWNCNVKGNNDLLSITQPACIKNIYLEYLRSGSRLIGTNTFSSTVIAQADYNMESLAYELNYASARLAREACDEITKEDPTKPRFVVGALGPTNRTGSISPSVEDPGFRNVTFDELVEAYIEQVVGLVDGGCDVLMGDNFRHIECQSCLICHWRVLGNGCPRYSRFCFRNSCRSQWSYTVWTDHGSLLRIHSPRQADVCWLELRSWSHSNGSFREAHVGMCGVFRSRVQQCWTSQRHGWV